LVTRAIRQEGVLVMGIWQRGVLVMGIWQRGVLVMGIWLRGVLVTHGIYSFAYLGGKERCPPPPSTLPNSNANPLRVKFHLGLALPRVRAVDCESQTAALRY
jgi:hypothetical protein